jgi:UDP-N-acetyl-D-mannosaminuronic acid dehydrogenase
VSIEQRLIVVIGMGYVGIPAAALLADVPGHTVTGIQRRSARSGWKIDLINSGGSPFPANEPGIAELIRRVVFEKRTLRVSDSWEAVKQADVVLIDVQTPVEAGDHVPRYESLREVCSEIGKRMRKGSLISVESTVAPGTMVHLVRPLLEKESGMKAGKDFHLCFSYERVMVGRLLHNIVHYPRIVGGFSPACAEAGAALYRRIVKAPVVPTDCMTAEVAKTVENAYRDVNIAFANEVALACESLGVDVFEVRDLVNNLPNDPSRPSSNPVRNMHLPGAGVGGHCLPKDSWLLKYGVDAYGKNPVDFRVIIESRMVNDAMPLHMADLIEEGLRSVGVNLSGAKIAVLGYAFLEDSDDTRNTPTVPLVSELRRRGARAVVIHDPYVREEELPEVKRDVYEVLAGADCACLVTKHSEYRTIDIARARSVMKRAVVVDGRNSLMHWKGSGFTVISVGKSFPGRG